MTSINPRSDRPPFKQLADALRERITAGEFPPGALLPSQQTLAAEFGVSATTARQGLTLLKSEGLISSAQGRGWFVRPHRVVRRRASSHYEDERAQLSRPADARDDAPFTHGHEFRDWQLGAHATVVGADDDLAGAFGVEPLTPLLRRTFVFFFDEGGGMEPHRRSFSYLLMGDVGGTPIVDPANEPWPGGTMAQLDSVGVVVDAVEEVVSARMPALDEVDELDIDEGVPVLCVRRRMLAGGRVVEVCDIVIPSDRVDLQYVMELGS
jgi:GntR family transcriptional regulator